MYTEKNIDLMRWTPDARQKFKIILRLAVTVEAQSVFSKVLEKLVYNIYSTLWIFDMLDRVLESNLTSLLSLIMDSTYAR